MSVRAGSTSSNAGGQLVGVTAVVNHPEYNAQTLNNDISVMNLASALNTAPAGVAVIGRPAQGAGTATGTVATVAGWGAIAEGGGAQVGLRAVSKPVVDNPTCNAVLGGGITAQMLCAGVPAGGIDACVRLNSLFDTRYNVSLIIFIHLQQGDSGGPLTAGGQLIGVVSWGIGCARPNSPGVYARTSSYTTWINGLL